MVKILIVRLSSLGDIVHTYPMIYDIKANVSNCIIDWLVDESFIGLVKANSLVDNVIGVPLRKIKKNKLKLLSNLKFWKQQLKTTKYDYIIDSQGLLKSAILTKVFNGKVYGLGRNSIREKLASFFYDYTYETGKNILAITKNRLLAASIFNYDIDVINANFGFTVQKFPLPNLSFNSPYVVFFHATSKDSKKYPYEYWAQLANYLTTEYGFSVILPFGSELERQESLKIKQLANLADTYIPTQTFSYSELYGLISSAQFVFGVDTGLIHLANALNKKLIAIYVDTNPAKTGVFESIIAKNLGAKNIIPTISQVTDVFDKIIKI